MKHNLLALCVLAFGLQVPVAWAGDKEAGVAFFEAKIRPVLAEHCFKCHGETKQKGSLRLDSSQALRKGGVSGAIVVPNQADKSLLINALRHQGEVKMPQDKKLPDVVVADFVKWINLGAPDPRDGTAPAVKDISWTDARKFWAFQPVRKVESPQMKNSAWAKTPIDRFILAQLEAADLSPVRPADRRELLRRATFDLIGLPPTPEDVEAFLKDQAPDAYAKVIDRLLGSPHYGERWGRYWLDVARYAEDQAHTFGVKPNTMAYRYRDWVITAINEDMPYDRFVRLQIAADLIEKDEAERIKHLPALGFFGLGAQYYKNTDAAKAAADELDDRIDTLTRGFLGLTVSCARCHDHKFDPVPTQDYYSLAGIFQSCRLTDLPLAKQDEQKRFQAQQDKIKKAQGEMQEFLKGEKNRLSEQRAADASRYLLAAWKQQERKSKEPKWSLADQAREDKLDATLLTRWVKYLEQPPSSSKLMAWKKLPQGDAQQATNLAKNYQGQVDEALVARKKGKLDKAGQDLLQGLFGDKGLLTPSDNELNSGLSTENKKRLDGFKTEVAKLQKENAAKPLPMTHGLAEATVANMKVFLRGNPAKLGEVAPRRFLRILAGDQPAPFTQGSGRLELAQAITAKDNPLTARVMVNRVWQNHFGRGLVGTPSNFGQLGERPTHPELLDYLAARFMETGWSLKTLHRDIMLSAVYQQSSATSERHATVDGDNKLLGRMNRRRLDIESWRDSMLAVSGKLDAKLGGPTSDLSANNVRRTVYAKVSRHDLNQLLRLFDFPDANITSERRIETTVPQQQLFVINGPFVVETAKALAARVQKEAPDDPARVQRLFALALGRAAAPEETQYALDYLKGRDDPAERNQLSRWERFAQVILGSNEFMYVD